MLPKAVIVRGHLRQGVVILVMSTTRYREAASDVGTVPVVKFLGGNTLPHVAIVEGIGVPVKVPAGGLPSQVVLHILLGKAL